MNSVTFGELVELADPAGPCVVLGCHAEGRDRHHWAPGSRFSVEQDRWPTARLCRWHHVQWHTVMSGYIWGGLRFIPSTAEYRPRRAA